jgi:hypothetical protein
MTLPFVSTQVGTAQDAPGDSLKGVPFSQDSTYTEKTDGDSIVVLPLFFEMDDLSLFDDETSAERIDLSGNRARIHYSLRDAMRPSTDFYGLTFGPMGQAFSLSYLGLPSYMIATRPDSPDSYDLYQFPPTGLADYRLFSLEQGDVLRVSRNGSAGAMASVAAHRSAFNDSTALADVSMFKGDYSFANTDVIFRQAVGDRFAWGMNIGVEQSNGYLKYSSRKERENYNLDLRWKLNNKWQIRSDLRLMSCDDDVAQLGRWTDVTAEREVGLRQATVDALSEDSAGNATRLTVSYGRFDEKLRSPYLFLRQQHESMSASAELVRRIPLGRLALVGRLLRNRVTFDPGYVYYTRFRVEGSLAMREDSPVRFLAAGHYLFDYGDASRVGATLGSSMRASDHVSASLIASLDYIPPSDMARFLKPRGYDFDFDGADEYAHSGDPSLKPVVAKTASAAIVVHTEDDSLIVSARASRLDDLAVWQDRESDGSHLYRSEASNFNLYSLSASGVVRLPVNLLFSPSYTYARLSEAGSDRNASLMPRHNVYAILSSEQRIAGLKLDVRPSIEVEYHSINYSSYANPVDLGAYFIVHFRLSIKLKNFTYFYTMENVFDKPHETVYEYPSRRRVWWGIRWLFLN